ncbi:oxidoreductase [Streptomyces sp. NPDC050400]|uniref:oxidoreductase n=1 Tax=Streptomyces sp. NPDC050400 TaxID=3365610 RepID=UPI003796D8B8
MSKVWLITGANSGFGRAFTTAAVAAGDIVVATARRPEALADLVEAHPGRVEAQRLDVTDTAAPAAVVADVMARHGRIDVLVNNAGRGHVGAAEETTEAELRGLFDLHFFGPAALVRAVLPHMRERRSGAIVQMSSMGGQMSFAGVSAYSATKFALEGFSEALRDEVAPLGIKVLVVEPGAFRTNFMGNLSASTPLPENSGSSGSSDYAATVGATRTMMEEHTRAAAEPGDPAKAAATVIAALASDATPLRLPLGDDGVDAVVGHLDAVRDEVAAWEKVSRATAFDA